MSLDDPKLILSSVGRVVSVFCVNKSVVFCRGVDMCTGFRVSRVWRVLVCVWVSQISALELEFRFFLVCLSVISSTGSKHE